MITDPGGTRIYRVRKRSPTARGEWFFADLNRAQNFVESKINGQVAWVRKHQGKWIVERGDTVYRLEEVEVVDAAGILVDENAQYPA